MSLEELLKDPQGSSAWKGERKKLLRVVLGISIAAAALGGGAYLIVSMKNRNALKHQTLVNEQNGNAKSLAQLMRLQKETKALQEELKALRRPASLSKGRGQRSSAQIISFEPGEGFVAVGAKGQDPYIPTGAVFRARLITPIKTSVEKTFVMAETTNEFHMDMKRKIPSGSRLIGRSRLNPVLKGVIVEFDRLVLPNGIETTISGLGLSRNALPEIDGLYFSDDLQNYGTALAFGFLSGFADASRQRDFTILGSQPQVSVGNEVLAGLSTASFQVAEDILRDIRTRAIEYVVVPAGEQIFVALTGRYEMAQGVSK